MTDLPPEHALAWLRARRSIRTFTAAPVEREVIDRLLAAAVSAPSNSNRQPWRYLVVQSAPLRAQLAGEVRAAAEALQATIAASRHAAELGSYADFFWQPLAAAPLIIIPCVRQLPDTLGSLLRSAGAAPGAVQLPSDMPMEVCAVAASVMALLLQAHAEGLGACWMAGPMIAAARIEALLGLRQAGEDRPSGPRMLGAIALGYPDETARAGAKPARRPTDRDVQFF
jgi:nitroreductase